MKKILLLLCLPVFTNGQIITTVAGNASTGYTGDGAAATAATLHNPNQVAVDNLGNLYIADGCNNVIRKVNSSGTISTFAGTGYEAGSCGSGDFSGDGGPAVSARFRSPFSVVADPSHNIYVGDDNNEIRKINTTGTISDFAGQGPSVSTDAAYNNDGGPASAVDLIYPLGLAADNAGNIYYIDGSTYQVRMISSTGIVKTIAGVGCCGAYSGDNGPGTAAAINNPTQIAVDNAGNVYIADDGNYVIRKVNSSGVITTFAGNGSVGYSGDGGAATAAKLWDPKGVATDAAGNVYIADAAVSRIRKVDVAGTITTIAGTGTGPATGGYSGDNGAATAASINGPTSIAVDASGNIYFTDYGNQVIRKIGSSSTMSVHNPALINGTVELYPNPAGKLLYIKGTNITNVAISNLLGQTVYSQDYNAQQVQVDVADLPTGMYLVRINGTEVRKFAKE